MAGRDASGHRGRFWPWVVLALSIVPAVWYVLDFESDIDPEFPGVVRPTFNLYPPPAYRFGEPGDTIDHAAVYVASAALVLSVWGLFGGRDKRLWVAATAMSLAGFWHAATPGALLDGWHGLGWRNLMDPRSPGLMRLSLAAAAAVLMGAVVWGLCQKPPWHVWKTARQRGVAGLLLVSAILIVLRQLGGLDREPLGFWPRWMFVWGLLAWALALLMLAPAAPSGWSRAGVAACLVLLSLGLDFTGRGIFWYQRPLHRLREVVPGRIYISAMPTYQGLELAQERHRFKTIINLFPEYTPERSPHWPDEVRFVREHGLNYVGNEPGDDPTGEAFIAQTLSIAQDPSAWPILVHCHASMDRSPAWMGLYRFVVQGWPLADALREIEQHRGLRPKASVTLLYNRVLARLAPRRASMDPTALLLQECARGTEDPAIGLMCRPDGDVRSRDQAHKTQDTKRR